MARAEDNRATLPLSAVLAIGIGSLVLLAVAAVLTVVWTTFRDNTHDLLREKVVLVQQMTEMQLEAGASLSRPSLPTLVLTPDGVWHAPDLPPQVVKAVQALPEPSRTQAPVFRPMSVGTERYLVMARSLPAGVFYTLVGAREWRDPMLRVLWSGLAGLFILAVSVMLAIWAGRALARPIEALAVGAESIEKLDLQNAIPMPRSIFSELDRQARAFNAMLAGLRWFETYVPKGLVRKLMQQAQGGEIASVTVSSTLMFTDIVGFTEYSEALPASDVADFLNHHFTVVTRAIEAEGGTVDKFIGDCVMAFWNAPERQEDHAVRAVRAALAIREAILADNSQRSAAAFRGEIPFAAAQPVRMRIGIHSGEVVAGNIGTQDRRNYTIVGDTVNTCQRIEQLGKEVSAGEPVEVMILMSSATRAALPASMVSEEVGNFSLKGRHGRMSVHRLA
ncbi:MAG: hypothetical protein A2018_00215 [Alphaproteobacteria bacterium GWF2_58_20]|nr:MAG: hypothetical protein A2018_00215 [Alphaproteobacteria bacterium GWF2_58_20]